MEPEPTTEASTPEPVETLNLADELLGRFERIDEQLATIRRELVVQWIAILAVAALVALPHIRSVRRA